MTNKLQIRCPTIFDDELKFLLLQKDNLSILVEEERKRIMRANKELEEHNKDVADILSSKIDRRAEDTKKSSTPFEKGSKEYQETKDLFHQVSKLTHPDKLLNVDEEDRERLIKLFKKASDFHDVGDLEGLTDILMSLDKVTDEQLIEKRIASVKKEIAGIHLEYIKLIQEVPFQLTILFENPLTRSYGIKLHRQNIEKQLKKFQ